MKNLVRCFSLFVILSMLWPSAGQAQASCEPDPPAKILLVGDSWSEIMWENRIIRTTLDRNGYGDWKEEGEWTALTGSTASLWVDPAFMTLVRNQLEANPALEVVVLLTGGNDLLAGRFGGGWAVTQTPEEQLAFFNRMEDYMRIIINNIKNTRPGIKVVICGYDYINLFNTLNEPVNLVMWDNLGQPSARQLNDALVALEQRKIDIANGDPNVYYLQNMGRMQYHYGYPGFFSSGVAPLPGNNPPGYAPFPGGFRDFPTPTVALANNGTDPIHLTNAGYSHICGALFDWFFYPLLKSDVNAAFKSPGWLFEGFLRPNNTGGINNFRLGRDGAGYYRNIMIFGTAGLPDNAVIHRASIFLTRSGSSFIPLPKALDQMDCQLDIKRGYFGIWPGIDIADYNAPVDAEDIGCFVGSASGNNAKVRIDIDPSALGFIDPTFATQFRFYTKEPLSGTTYTSFYDGDAPADRKPVLEIVYTVGGRSTEEIVRIGAERFDAKAGGIYPNPVHAGEMLHFPSVSASSYFISDVTGRTCHSGNLSEGEIAIRLPEHLSPGLFYVSFRENNSTSTYPVVIVR